MSARRDLGPEFEDAVVESFLDKMGQEIDRRVDERLAQAGPKGGKLARPGPSEGQRLALAIVSLSLATLSTVLFVLVDSESSAAFWIWLGTIIVNGLYNAPRKG
ncbi:hypothetical protein [Nonomuraea gerenzanensis]|uniref:Integral membrane protein n=1 Tax=Nonomuraea gerenzanensis TaxID=93944 RepID=A0A1M4EJR8_9ACTN|nr:hypothetical protein [Nonomuraea gerenzanensis]UBU10671.1 hypothetical protein LCN96_41040 [Nonomuraea gerenzanensis]SBO99090.1 integral membrane protein [Nonomuraea gerenzanensis]